MELKGSFKKRNWKKFLAVTMAIILTMVSLPKWSMETLAAGNMGAEENDVQIAEVHNDAEWLPVGDMEPIQSDALTEEEAKQAGLLEDLQPLRLPNPRLRSAGPITVVGGSTYGYEWISDRNHTGDNASILQGLYVAYAQSAYAAYQSIEDYQPTFNSATQTNTYYGTPVNISGFQLLRDADDLHDTEGEALFNLATAAFLYDNPQYYMVRGTSYYYNSSNIITSVMVRFSDEYVSANTRNSLQATMEAKYLEYKALADTATSTYDKVRLVHDKMLAERDYSYINNLPDENRYAHNIVGILDTSTAGPVCEAFTEAFSYILNRLGIPCVTIVGQASSGGGDGSGGHAWNLVQMEDGKYYYVDSTWNNRDSSITDAENLVNDVYYNYFLVGSGNTDFGAGSVHKAGNSNGANGYYLYGLPSNISTDDYIPSTPSPYLTDNGYYGAYTTTAADNYTYVIAKSNTLSGTSVGSKEGNPLLVLNSDDMYNWNDGPYIYNRKSEVDLFRWVYNSEGIYTSTIFPSYTDLTKGTDFTITQTDLVNDTVSRVWLQGTGAYRGIDFVLVKRPVAISQANITGFVSPVLGAVPQGAGALTPTGSANYQVTSLSWEPTADQYGGSTIYKATVTLTANAGYYFTDTTTVAVGANIVGDLSQTSISTSTIGTLSDDDDGNTLTFQATFPQTAADLNSILVRDEDGNAVSATQTLLIPALGAQTATSTLTAQVLGTDAAPYQVGGQDAEVIMTATLSNGAVLPTGITFSQNGNTGTLIVTNATAAGPHTVKLTMTSAVNSVVSGSPITQNLSVTVQRAMSIPQTIAVTGSTSAITIPTSDTPVTSSAFTKQITDQYGSVMMAGEGNWSLEAPNGGSLTGISIDSSGYVTVTKEAKAAVTDEIGKTYKVVYTEEASGKTGFAELVIRRAAAVVSGLELYHDSAFTSPVGATDTLVIPLTNESDKTYYAKVLDQYHTAMTGQMVSWTFATGDDAVSFTGSEGGESGTVTVADSAQDRKTYTVTATIGEQTAQIVITVRAVQVNWTGVSVEESMTYGDAKASVVTLPGSGTATAGNLTLNGTFSIEDPNTLLPAGSGTITVKFIVTSEGSYQGVSFTKDYAVTIEPKSITVSADDQSREYGEANSSLSFTVAQGTLVGSDTKDDLGLVLSTTATPESTPNSYPIIKASQTNTNYDITVTQGTVTVTKAALTLTGSPTSLGTILANNVANQSQASLMAAVGAANASLAATYAGGNKTTQLNAVWEFAQGEIFDPKGGAYTFTATLTPADTTLFTYNGSIVSLEVQVTPVTGTAVALSPASIIKSKAQVAALTDLADLGLTNSVTVQYDNGIDDTSYSVDSWTPSLNEVKNLAQTVTDENSITVNMVPNVIGIPSWATIDLSTLKTQLQITNKFPVTVTVTAPSDITYGESLDDPSVGQTDIGNGIESQPSYSYIYMGTTQAGLTYQSDQKPTQAGTYQVKAILISDDYSGEGVSSEFTIAQKPLTQEMLVINPTSYVFTGSAIVPTYQVIDAAGITASDYTPSYVNNLNVGTATVALYATTTGNYSGTTQQPFVITKAPAISVTPVVKQHGTVESGDKVQGSVDLNALLPTDKGTPIAYEIQSRDVSGGDVSGGDILGEQAIHLGAIEAGSDSIDENGVYHYTTTASNTPAETKVTIKVSMGNYQDTILIVSIQLLRKQIPEGQPASTAVSYGQLLSKSVLSGTMTNLMGEAIPGSFAWKDPDMLPSREQSGYAWIFTPTDTQLYTSVEGIVAVEVTKGTPQGEPSFTQILESGKTLAAAGLTGTFTNTNNGQPITGVLSWEGGDTQTVTPGTVYTWIFTPQDGINYETLKGSALVYPATYRIAVTADGAISGAYQFTSVNVGYDVPAGLVVKVQNTGNSPTGTLKLALSDSTGFTLSTQSMESLLAGETSNFLITPAKGLLAGTYTSQVTVMGEGNEIQGSLQISFIVSPIPEEPKEGDSESGGEEAELLVTQETVSIFEGLSQYIKSEVTDQNGNPVNVEQVFGGKSVEIRFTEDQEGAEDTQVALLLDLPQNKVFAFSISLYVQGTDELIQPQNGFTIKLQLPLPENLVNQRDELHVIRVIDGTAQILPHSIVQVNGQYVVEFSTDHFSTYAFVLGTISSGSGSGGSSSNGGNGSGSGTSDSESINNAPIGIAGQGVTSPKTGDVDDTGKNDEGQRSSSPLREEALMTISPISPKADVLPTILWITGFAIAGGIVITGISGGVIILAKKRKKNMK